MEQKKWEFLLFHCLAAKSLVQNILMFCWFICCSWEVGRLLSWLCSNWITVNLNLLNLSFFSPSNGLEVEGNRVLFIRSFCFNRKQNVKKKRKNQQKQNQTHSNIVIQKMALKYENLTRLYVVLGSGHAVCAEEAGLVQPASQPPCSQKEHFKSL